jgi:hypothetical protein
MYSSTKINVAGGERIKREREAAAAAATNSDTLQPILQM